MMDDDNNDKNNDKNKDKNKNKRFKCQNKETPHDDDDDFKLSMVFMSHCLLNPLPPIHDYSEIYIS